MFGASLAFVFWRFCQILTLIPIIGLLSYFVHIYASNNALTPNYILILFIVSVLATAWAILTLFTYHHASSNAFFVSLIDVAFVGALIAGVYYLRFITGQDCASVNSGADYYVSFGTLGNANVNGVGITVNKTCAMLKAAFALGIMNVFFFFFTSLLALFVGRSHVRKDTYVRESHSSRHGHRRSGSHRSHRSSNSRRPHV